MPPLKDFWAGFNKMWGGSLIAIGCSLPRYDDYFLQAFYNVSKKFIEFEPELAFHGRKKGKVKILDYRLNEESKSELKERYKFLSEDKREFWFEGFNEKSVDWLFEV